MFRARCLGMYVFTVCTPLSTLDHDGVVGLPAMNQALHLSKKKTVVSLLAY